MTRRRLYPPSQNLSPENIAFVVEAYLNRIEEIGPSTYAEIRDMRILSGHFFATFFHVNIEPHLNKERVDNSWGHYYRYSTPIMPFEMEAIPF